MANKTANVNARVEEDVKREAEGILSDMGIPASVGINMFYHQIIYCHGLPFRPVAPRKGISSLDSMTKQEFDNRMAQGLADAKADRGLPLDDAFEQLLGEMNTVETANG